MNYIFLAQGFEEIEMTAPLDLLRRAGVDVKTVSITDEKNVVGSHGIEYVADMTANELDSSNAISLIILPGGMPGTTNLDNSEVVQKYLISAKEQGSLICAICAAPMVLGKLGLLQGKEAICYPGFEQYLTGAKISTQKCVRDDNIITAAGAGVSVEFGLKIIEAICGKEISEKIKNGILA